jgi:hypothetical protein
MGNRIEAHFFIDDSGEGERVCIDLGRSVRLLSMPPETAYQWVETLLRFARQAERNQKGRRAMSRKEVDQVEEMLCGTPRVFLGG